MSSSASAESDSTGSAPTSSKARRVSLLAAVALGIGGMMGAGLYTLLGLAASTAGPWIPVAFLIAGFAASFTVYSYAKLGATYPSSGGAATFILEQFGTSAISGGINVFQYISYLIATSLYAAGFAEYINALFEKDLPDWAPRLIGPAVVVAFAVINVFGSQLVARAESYIIVIELVILVGFLTYGFFRADPTTFFSGDHHGSPLGILIAASTLYVTYQGFAVVANAAPEMKAPKREIPRAMFIALGVVTLIYVSVTVLVVMLVPDESLLKDAGHVLADAGSAVAGRLGFVVVSIAAILATASAVNATVFASSKIGTYLAANNQLPKIFQRSFGTKVQVPFALLASVAIIVVLVAVFPLSSVGQMASLAFLIIYAVVSIGHLRLRKTTGAKAWPLWAAIIINAIMFSVLLVNAVTSGPPAAWITLIGALVGSLLFALIRARRSRTPGRGVDAAR